MLHGNEQIFASKYKLVLPSEAELRTEMQREMAGLRKHLQLAAQPGPRKKLVRGKLKKR